MKILTCCQDPADRWNQTLRYFACEAASEGADGIMVISEAKRLLSIPGGAWCGQLDIEHTDLHACSLLIDDVMAISGVRRVAYTEQHGAFFLDLHGTLLQFDVAVRITPGGRVAILSCGKYLRAEISEIARTILCDLVLYRWQGESRHVSQYGYTCPITNKRYLVDSSGFPAEWQEPAALANAQAKRRRKRRVFLALWALMTLAFTFVQLYCAD